jgi:hypothetical protein
MLNVEYPGWTLDTVVDVKQYLNHHKTHGIEKFALVSLFKHLEKNNNKELEKWCRGKISSATFSGDKEKEMHEHLKKSDGENSMRYARKLLIADSKATDSEILDKCIELLGL